MDIYKPNEFAALVGVSVKTLQRWDNDGKLKAWLLMKSLKILVQD